MGLLAPHQVRVYLCSADLVFSDLAESATQVACPDLISSADDVMGKHLPYENPPNDQRVDAYTCLPLVLHMRMSCESPTH